MSEHTFTKGSVFIVSIEKQDFKYLTCIPSSKDEYSNVFRIKNGKILRYLEDSYLGSALWRVFEIIDTGDQIMICDTSTKFLEPVYHR